MYAIGTNICGRLTLYGTEGETEGGTGKRRGSSLVTILPFIQSRAMLRVTSSCRSIPYTRGFARGAAPPSLLLSRGLRFGQEIIMLRARVGFHPANAYTYGSRPPPPPPPPVLAIVSGKVETAGRNAFFGACSGRPGGNSTPRTKKKMSPSYNFSTRVRVGPRSPYGIVLLLFPSFFFFLLLLLSF